MNMKMKMKMKTEGKMKMMMKMEKVNIKIKLPCVTVITRIFSSLRATHTEGTCCSAKSFQT